MIPPIRKIAMKPIAKYSEVVITIDPRHKVAIQLKILTPVGIPIRNELSMKKPSTTTASGEANRWCPQTSTARNAITAVDAAIAL